MSGSFLGKRIECLPVLFDLYDLEKSEQKVVYDYFKIIENVYRKHVSKHREAELAKSKSKGAKTK